MAPDRTHSPCSPAPMPGAVRDGARTMRPLVPAASPAPSPPLPLAPMNGIAGLVRTDGGPVDARDLGRMTAALSHRGAHEALWTEASVGLGLRSDASETARSGPLALVADARIDNRDDLARPLGLHPDASDEAFILAAYERWGEACPRHLVGAFAFALWDGRSQTLVCARDHFGIRPFHYHDGREVFALGTEIKAVLALPDVPRAIHEGAIADYIAFLPGDGTETFYQGVRRLAPGHTLTVSREGTRLRQYWTPEPERTLRLGSDAEYAEAFREHFDRAVACRLRGPGAVGSTLSGGLDSSSIPAVASRQLGERGPLDTFSLVFDEAKKSDERKYIAPLLARGGFRPHEVHGDRLDVFEDLDPMLRHLDEPFYGVNLYLHWGLYRAAREQGVRVLLDGLIGDSTVFHGDVYLTELVTRGRWLAFAREFGPTARKWGGGWKGATYVARRYVSEPLVTGPLRAALGRPGPSPARLLSPELAQRAGVEERARDEARGWRRAQRSVRVAHVRELGSSIVPIAFGVVDHASAAFGIKARYPFADRRLVEFCAALPADQRFRGGQTRHILRRAMRDVLPEEIHSRTTKGNLGHALALSLRGASAPALRSMMEDRLEVAAPFLNLEAVREMYRRHLLRGGGGRARLLLWQTSALIRWLEMERE